MNESIYGVLGGLLMGGVFLKRGCEVSVERWKMFEKSCFNVHYLCSREVISV